MPSPKNVAELRRALGMFGWYSRFIANKADIKIPSMRFLRKENLWQWGSAEEEAICRIKSALTEAPVLARPDFSRTFTIHADSSQYAVGGVLTQEFEDGEHSIEYFSRVLTPIEQRDGFWSCRSTSSK